MFSKVQFFGLAATVLAVAAQDTTSTSSAADATSSALAGISQCVLACVIPAATLNNCSFTDASCVCASAQFQADATACLMAHCSPADLAAATALQTSQCTAAGIAPTGSATTTNSIPFNTPTGTRTGTGVGATDTTTPPTPTGTRTGTGQGASTTPTTATTPATTGSGTGTTTAPATTTSSGAGSGVVANLAFVAAAVAGLIVL